MRTILCGLVLLTSTTVLAANKFQPLNVKVGLWEVSLTGGQPPIPPESLAKLTPEQRARIEESMKANSAGKTGTTKYKSCVTKEKLEKDPTFSEKSNCTWTVLTSTSSKVAVRGECPGRDFKSHITLQVEALNPESVKGTGQVIFTGAGQPMNANSTFSAKWIGPACGNVK